jgi:type VI secretion system protein VasG
VERSITRLESVTGMMESLGYRVTNRVLDVSERQARIAKQRAEAATQAEAIQARYEVEKKLVDQVLDLRARLREAGAALDAQTSLPAPLTALDAATASSPPPAAAANPGAALASAEAPVPVLPSVPPVPTLSPAERAALLAELGGLQVQLTDLQGDRPLILPLVDEQAVAGVVQDWTGVPVGRMVKNEVEAVLKLADTMNERVIGQKHALDMIARRIQTSRASLDNPNKPIGVFMLCGPSGVGKTETALALAESLYGGEQNVITLNMSEYQEAHTISTLKGAPPGYVGYGEGGVLTEAVRRRPYSVVLLDEVEKAHSDVHELFFQVFDKGWMEDGEGRFIDFKNTIILLTSNVGSDLIMSLCKDPELTPGPEGIARALREPLLKVFPAALLGRLVVIPYYPLSDEVMANIVRLQLGRIRKRLQVNHGIPFEYGEDVVKLVVSRCTEAESGGRVIDAILTNTVLPRISIEYLNRLTTGEPLKSVRLAVKDSDFEYGFG